MSKMKYDWRTDSWVVPTSHDTHRTVANVKGRGGLDAKEEWLARETDVKVERSAPKSKWTKVPQRKNNVDPWRW